MSQLAVQFLEQGFHRVLFDAMPVPVFVVDKNVCIYDYNAAAARFLGKNKKLVTQWRGGKVLNCVHSIEGLEGCGTTPSCRDCVVRKSVRTAARGRRVVRQWAQMDLVRKGRIAKVKLRVSCQPFTFGKSSFILLVLEGLND
jgi:nitrogen fixation/metabolism regulation signal transduction histidine kinase